MKKVAKPYKEACVLHITQSFHSGHKALDLSHYYGTLLTAPESCQVSRIITPKVFDGSKDSLSRGYGIVVPDSAKLKYPYPGKHLHWAMKINQQTVDPLKWLDWNIPVKYSFLDKIKAMMKILMNMLDLIKGR